MTISGRKDSVKKSHEFKMFVSFLYRAERNIKQDKIRLLYEVIWHIVF